MIKENQFIIYLEMYLYRAKKLIIKRDCTFEDLDEAAMYLNKCKSLASAKETRIDVWLGKLELKRSKLSRNNLDKKLSLSNAKNSFLMSLNKGYTPSACYGLFKVFVAEEDWESAKTYLSMYEKSDCKKRYNFTLVHRLIDECMGIENEYPLDRSTYIFANKVEYQPLRENYRLAEEAFSNHQYNRCLKHLLVCQKLATIKSITIDFSQVISMVTKLIEMKNIRIIDELKMNILKTANSGERIILIRKILSISPQEVELYFLLIDSYLELGAYSCIPEILLEVVKQPLSDIDIKRVKYYENLANEQRQYDGKMITVFRDLQVGEVNASNGDIYQAYTSFLNGLKNSGHSLFLSKLGDLFYTNGFYQQAEQYYLRYLSSGYENQFNVYINLYKTYKRLSKDDKALLIAHESFSNLFLEAKGYTLGAWINQLECEYNAELTSDDSVKVKELPPLPAQFV